MTATRLARLSVVLAMVLAVAWPARGQAPAETVRSVRLDNELRYLGRLREVTAAQIQAAARKYFGDTDVARVRFLPAGAR